ncbi:MAG: hypothetical protein EBR86_06180 [Planctomycetia bacterium]|nr:hypothetical protein [Planctomycetia bacterium]
MSMHWLRPLAIGLAISPIMGTLAVPGGAAPPAPVGVGDWIDTGLSPAERRTLHHEPIGSELLPLGWLLALESADGSGPFVDTLERHGFLPDPDDPEGLPIGMTVTGSADARFSVRMVGLTCAACHVGALTHGGRTRRIDGAPNMLFIEAFTLGLADATGATAENPRKLLAFVKRVAAGPDPDFPKRRPAAARLVNLLPDFDSLADGGELEKNLATRLHDAVQIVAEETAIDLAPVPPAARPESPAMPLWKRITARLEVDARALARSVRATPALAAESEEALTKGIDELWAETVETARLLRGRAALLRRQTLMKGMPGTPGGPGRVDDFGFARNLMFPVDEMRPPDAPCSVPVLWATATVRWQGWDGNNDSAMGRNLATAMASGATFDAPSGMSTALPRRLAAIEEITARITTPPWPEDWLGPLDAQAVARGRDLFRTHCHDCHRQGADPPPDRVVPVAEIGTDPNRARNFDAAFARAIEEQLGRFKKVAYDATGIAGAEAERLDGGRSERWRATGGYAARPLAGLWASAPYLHNASVPTLHDLLEPAAQRPVRFAVGHRDFDPVRVGVAPPTADPVFILDTTVTGNHNTGHEYGTTLPEADRRDLLEYLKTL